MYICDVIVKLKLGFRFLGHCVSRLRNIAAVTSGIGEVHHAGCRRRLSFVVAVIFALRSRSIL